jgi:hypothetical protein
MGQILSSSTVYSVAYLTEKGRALLFDENNTRFITDQSTGEVVDLFKIEYFTLSDPDTNYKLTSGVLLESGDVPDISGKNEDGIKGALDFNETCLISFDGVIEGENTSDTNFNYQYDVNVADDILVINVNVDTIPDMLPVE